MAMVKAMTITIDSLLPRLKLDYDMGYDAAVKGTSVVVLASPMRIFGESKSYVLKLFI